MGIIEIRNLTYNYPQSDQPALREVSLTVNEGEIVVLMGHTGCGKSTLCLALNGIIPHAIGGSFSGEVVVDGLNTLESTIPELASRVGMVFQNPETQLFSARVISEVAFGPENLALPREEIIERVKWAIEATRLCGYEDRPPMSLSGGEKQQVALASALAMRPKILVLDEPTSELDPAGTYRIFSMVKEMREKFGITFIIVEHKEEAVKMADRVVLMKDGMVICDGDPRTVFSNIKAVSECKVRPPQVSQLFYLLSNSGLNIEKIPITHEEAARVIRGILEKRLGEDLGRIRLKEHREITTAGKNSKPVVEFLNVSYQYRNGPMAIRDLNLKIYEGEFVAVIGHNGSGKTTMMKLINGLLLPTKGDVLVNSLNTKDLTVSEMAKTVGYIFQNPDHQIFSFTVWDEVAFGPKNLDLPPEEVESRVKEALQTVGLWKMRERHPFTLSRGQRQRLAVASVLAMHPKIIILDEPTTGQDEVAINQIMTLVDRLRREGRTIIMVTHDMSIVTKYAERTIVLRKGEVLMDGPTRDVFLKPEVLRESLVDVPPIMKLAGKLSNYGVPKGILTVEEMYNFIVGR